MTETAPDRAATADDLGQALASLLRRYLEGAREATGDLPGGPRGYQVLANATPADCSNQATLAQRLGLDRTVMTPAWSSGGPTPRTAAPVRCCARPSETRPWRRRDDASAASRTSC
jgi:hypothetical protein